MFGGLFPDPTVTLNGHTAPEPDSCSSGMIYLSLPQAWTICFILRNATANDNVECLIIRFSDPVLLESTASLTSFPQGKSSTAISPVSHSHQNL
jgi:hypothetical protein